MNDRNMAGGVERGPVESPRRLERSGRERRRASNRKGSGKAEDMQARIPAVVDGRFSRALRLGVPSDAFAFGTSDSVGEPTRHRGGKATFNQHHRGVKR
jgi:hypothetical protein